THYNSSAFPEIEKILRTEKLDFLQINYSLMEPEAEQRVLPLAQERGVAVIVNRPFGAGDLFDEVRSKPLPGWAAEFDCRSWAQVFSAPNPKFVYTDASGKKQSADVVDKYYPKKIVKPFAKLDANIDPKLRRAATIAEERAHAHSLSKCWRFVKEALVAAGVVKSRPQTTLAKQAGQELMNNYGFKKLAVTDPYQAPVGTVLVYGAKRAAGHVEIRTE